MPISDPLNVNISPNATSTLWWISPIGGITNPAISNVQPKPHITTAVIN